MRVFLRINATKSSVVAPPHPVNSPVSAFDYDEIYCSHTVISIGFNRSVRSEEFRFDLPRPRPEAYGVLKTSAVEQCFIFPKSYYRDGADGVASVICRSPSLSILTLPPRPLELRPLEDILSDDRV